MTRPAPRVCAPRVCAPRVRASRVRASRVRASVVLAATLLVSSCAAPLLKLPTEPGAPAPDAAAILEQATAACRGIRTFSAELGVGGRIGGRGLRRARLLVGVAAPASVYIDAPAPFGASVFIFSATDADATLLMPRDRRVLEHGRPDLVLEAITGVPLTPEELRETLTGCATGADARDARQVGEAWRVLRGSSEWYLQRQRAADPWRLVAVVHHESNRPAWRVEYRDFRDGLPRAMRLISADAGRFDVSLTLSQVEINVPFEPNAFRVQVPPNYSPISLEDLRRAGPLAEDEHHE